MRRAAASAETAAAMGPAGPSGAAIGPAGARGASAGGTRGASAGGTRASAGTARGKPTEPCLHCGHPVPVRLMGCKGGHCRNCRHPYPHGDCSD